MPLDDLTKPMWPYVIISYINGDTHTCLLCLITVLRFQLFAIDSAYFFILCYYCHCFKTRIIATISDGSLSR